MSPNDDLHSRLDVPESESDIRRLMAEYPATRDFAQEMGQHIASLFTSGGIWEGTGPLRVDPRLSFWL